MPTDYERVYRGARQAPGEPTEQFVEFFDALPGARLRVLDVGCGQGRGALFIARLGQRWSVSISLRRESAICLPMQRPKT